MPQRHRLLPKRLLPKRIRPPAEAAPAETLPAPAEAAPAEFSLFTFRPDSTSPGSEESDWEGPTGRLRSDHQSGADLRGARGASLDSERAGREGESRSWERAGQKPHAQAATGQRVF